VFHRVGSIEESRLNLSGELVAHRDRRVRLDVADCGDGDRHILLSDLGSDYGLCTAAATATATAATASTTSRTGSSLGSGLVAANGDDRNRQECEASEAKPTHTRLWKQAQTIHYKWLQRSRWTVYV